MALPNSIDPGSPPGSDSPSLGAPQFRNLKQFLVDIFGFPISPTTIAAAGALFSSAGMTKQVFQSLAADPAAIGEMARNGAVFKFHDGVGVGELTDSFGSVGNTSVNNSVTAATKWDLIATTVRLRNSNNQILTKHNPGVITNDLTLAAALNGRDQAAAFADGAWIHYYWAGNATTLGSLSSLTAPPTGPTLQGGATAWSYCGAVKLNAIQTLATTRFFGNLAWIELNDTGTNRVLNAGSATVFTFVDCATSMPPNSQLAVCNFNMAANNATVPQTPGVFIRPTGSLISVGQRIAQFTVEVPNLAEEHASTGLVYTNTAQRFDYRLNAAPATTTVSIHILGYYMPN